MSAIEKINSHDTSRRASSSSSPKTRIDVKIVIMGHGGVGKTSFINRYIRNDFAETDTAGQERFTKISNYYCRGAQAAILAYDITDRDSFDALDNYIKFLADVDRDCIVVVIGTKLDLVNKDSDRRQVSEEEGDQYARQHRASFYETSAKDNLNVTSVFDRIAYQCLAPKLASEENSGSTVDTTNSRLVVASAATPTPTLTQGNGADKKLCCSVQ